MFYEPVVKAKGSSHTHSSLLEGGVLNYGARVSLLSNTHHPEAHPVTIKSDVWRLITTLTASVWNAQNAHIFIYIPGTFEDLQSAHKQQNCDDQGGKTYFSALTV